MQHATNLLLITTTYFRHFKRMCVFIFVKLHIVEKGQMTQYDMKNANHFNKRWCCYGKCSFRCKKYVNLIEKCRQSIRFAILQWYLCWTQWLCKSAAAGPDLLCDVIMSKIWIVVGIEIGRFVNEVRSFTKKKQSGKICLCVSESLFWGVAMSLLCSFSIFLHLLLYQSE